MVGDSSCVYYFQYKQHNKHRSIIGKLSKIEIRNTLGSRILDVATPEIFPPGSIVWYAGTLTLEEIQMCQWLTFVGKVCKLGGIGENWSLEHHKCKAEQIRADYNARQILN